MRGEFTHGASKLVTPNTVVAEGEETFLKMICQDDQAVIAGGSNFYVGLCADLAVSNDTVLADLTEPSAGGYARQAAPRSSVGWPSVVATANGFKANTQTVTFAAAGVDFNVGFSRFFLASSIDGTGKLLAISDALPAAIILVAGSTYPVSYALYLR